MKFFPQKIELIGGFRTTWTFPTKETISRLSATCWMAGKKLHQNSNIPVGLVGVYVNSTDIRSWSPPEAVRTCGAQPLRSGGYWNGMLAPLLNLTAAGAILYEGAMDVERKVRLRF